MERGEEFIGEGGEEVKRTDVRCICVTGRTSSKPPRLKSEYLV